MAVRGIFRRPGLRSLAFCAMVVAAALGHASQGLAQDAGTAGLAGGSVAGKAGPSVVVDLSALDQAVALRRMLPPADAPSPLRPEVSLPGAPASPPVPGTPAFSALFPPPPPVPAEPAQAPRRTDQASVERISPAVAVAALPVARPVAPDRRVRLRLPYPVAGTHLSPSAEAQLEALVAEVGADDRVRLRLAAYANAGAGSATQARRTSIARALAVRGFLIERGIKAGRIDLRALGQTAGAAEADRVDVVVADK